MFAARFCQRCLGKSDGRMTINNVSAFTGAQKLVERFVKLRSRRHQNGVLGAIFNALIDARENDHVSGVI